MSRAVTVGGALVRLSRWLRARSARTVCRPAGARGARRLGYRGDYQMYHRLPSSRSGLARPAALAPRWQSAAVACFAPGIVLFSGSLYLLALSASAPSHDNALGGVCSCWLVLGCRRSVAREH